MISTRTLVLTPMLCPRVVDAQTIPARVQAIVPSNYAAAVDLLTPMVDADPAADFSLTSLHQPRRGVRPDYEQACSLSPDAARSADSPSARHDEALLGDVAAKSATPLFR